MIPVSCGFCLDVIGTSLGNSSSYFEYLLSTYWLFSSLLTGPLHLGSDLQKQFLTNAFTNAFTLVNVAVGAATVPGPAQNDLLTWLFGPQDDVVRQSLQGIYMPCLLHSCSMFSLGLTKRLGSDIKWDGRDEHRS